MNKVVDQEVKAEHVPAQAVTNELYSQAINVALEAELAFKLMSFRVTPQEAFVQRVLDLCEYMVEAKRHADNAESNLKKATNGEADQAD